MTEYMAHFYIDLLVISAPSPYPTSVIDVDSVCPQTILPMRAAFPSGIIEVTNIGYRNNRSVCSELNWKHAG